jgi:hypothetical protein
MSDHAAHRPPLLAYAGLIAVFQVALGWVSRARVRRDAERLEWRDVALFGVATHKVTNLVARDEVTKVVREPFVEEEVRDGEVRERPAGRGLRRALGQAVTCPYCLGPWTALAFSAGHTISPRVTRFVATLFTAVAISDFLHHHNELLKARTEAAKRLGSGPPP